MPKFVDTKDYGDFASVYITPNPEPGSKKGDGTIDNPYSIDEWLDVCPRPWTGWAKLGPWIENVEAGQEIELKARK